jgi:hypothetical protein
MIDEPPKRLEHRVVSAVRRASANSSLVQILDQEMDRLDCRETVLPRLATKLIARRSIHVEADPRKLTQNAAVFDHFLGEAPAAVHREDHKSPSRRHEAFQELRCGLTEIDAFWPRKQDHRKISRISKQREKLLTLVKIRPVADPRQGLFDRKLDQPCRADRFFEFLGMNQNNQQRVPSKGTYSRAETKRLHAMTAPAKISSNEFIHRS